MTTGPQPPHAQPSYPPPPRPASGIPWKLMPMAVWVGAILFVGGFYFDITTSSSRTVNGEVVECAYRDYGSFMVAPVLVVSALVGGWQWLRTKDQPRVPGWLIAAAMAALLLGAAFHVLRGIWSWDAAC